MRKVVSVIVIMLLCSMPVYAETLFTELDALPSGSIVETDRYGNVIDWTEGVEDDDLMVTEADWFIEQSIKAEISATETVGVTIETRDMEVTQSADVQYSIARPRETYGNISSEVTKSNTSNVAVVVFYVIVALIAGFYVLLLMRGGSITSEKWFRLVPVVYIPLVIVLYLLISRYTANNSRNDYDIVADKTVAFETTALQTRTPNPRDSQLSGIYETTSIQETGETWEIRGYPSEELDDILMGTYAREAVGYEKGYGLTGLKSRVDSYSNVMYNNMEQYAIYDVVTKSGHYGRVLLVFDVDEENHIKEVVLVIIEEDE